MAKMPCLLLAKRKGKKREGKEGKEEKEEKEEKKRKKERKKRKKTINYVSNFLNSVYLTGYSGLLSNISTVCYLLCSPY